MILTARVTTAELRSLLESLTPLRVAIDETRGRWLTIGRPQLTVVPGRGYRLRGDARLAWEALGITVPVTLDGLQVLLVPKVLARGAARLLAFEPVVEELGLRLVPGFLEDKITDAVRDWLAKSQERLAWTFSRTLSRRLGLSEKIHPRETFEIAAVAGQVTVSEEELRFAVRFEAKITRGVRPDQVIAAAATTSTPITAPSAVRSGTPGGRPRRRRSSPRERA